MKPIIYKIEDNESALDEFEKDIRENKSKKTRDIILNYPTVYIHVLKKGKRYNVYVGETNNIIQRTKEHYYDGRDKENWEYNLLNKKFQLYVIGHEHFTKSMTLDIENRLRLYFMSVENVNVVYNERGNPQNKYYTDQEFDGVFQQVWEKLRKFDSELFPCDSQIKNSAVF